MRDPNASDAPAPAGLRTRFGQDAGLDPAIKIGFAVSAVWLLLALLFWLVLGGPGAITGLAVLVAVLLPLVLIWLAAILVRQASALREDSARLNAVLDQMDQRRIADAQSGRMTSPGRTAVDDKLDRVLGAQASLERRIAAWSGPGVADPAPVAETQDAAPAPQTEVQSSLDLARDPSAGAAVTADDFIKAINFPETAEDVAGFDALRRALADPVASRLVQAAQDVLTLLSQDGLYMDDMTPERSRPEVWRRFGEGERGRAIASLGGIRDKPALSRLAARMREDQIFRDTIHHFLRTFDHTFARFAPQITDAQIVRLSDTRTARAFMLLGRVAGLFD